MIKSNLIIATASQNYMNQALDELRALDKSLKAKENLGSGIMILEASINNIEFNKIVVGHKPVFVRHINTVDYVIDINEASPINAVVDSIKKCNYESLDNHTIAVQIRKINMTLEFTPLDLKNAIDEYLQNTHKAISVVKDPDKVLSVLIAGGKCYIGVSDVYNNLSSWSGGMIHYKKEEDDVSRAKFKLMEAIYVFDIDMSSVHKALDLGAAPGGWTSVLLENDIKVTAVDTGDMDERLMSNKALTYIKANASEVALEADAYDMITSDISWNPINTAKMVLSCAQNSLKQGGIAVVTVKLMNSKIGRTIKEVKSIYSEAFDIIQAKQLFHNRDEITLYMKKR